MTKHSPEMLRGAEAFMGMLRELELLERIFIPHPDPDIDQDDCTRHNYAAADKIVLDRLRDVLGLRDLPEPAQGFIQAMSTHFLNAFGGLVCWADGEDLLSDGGWRRNDIDAKLANAQQ